jgi:hypothetical protein
MGTNKTFLALAIACGAALPACGGIDPGEYVVYRVASSSDDLSSSCDAGANIDDDSSSFRAAETMVLFAGEEGAFYLDVGGIALEGEMESTDLGDEYTFTGATVDVEFSSPDGTGTKWTTTVRTTVHLVADGDMASGDTDEKTTVKCSGELCGDDEMSCTVSTDFVGTRVEDVDLEHQVN